MNITQARERAEVFIFIFCDDPSHPRRVAVTNFARVRGDWIEVPASRAAAEGYVGTGRHLVDDAMPAAGWALTEDVGAVRDRHELTCRKCKVRPVPVRADNLHAALDRLTDAGVSEVSLAGVAATLGDSERP